MRRTGSPACSGVRIKILNQNDVLSYLKSDLREHRELINRVYVHFVFKGDVDAAERSEGLSNRLEDIGNKAHLVTNFFGRDVELQPDFIADKPGHKGPPPAQSYVVHLRESGTATHEGRTMRVGFMPLMDLYGIFKALGQKFFDRNIRATLSPDNAPNKKIRDALDRIVLKEAEEPSIFVFRHNGITLAAERVRITDGKLTLHVPRLFNGAQTVSTWRALSRKARTTHCCRRTGVASTRSRYWPRSSRMMIFRESL